MFRIFKNEKKEKETKNHEKNSKTKKPEKNQRKKTLGCRRVNGPAQYCAHAGGAGLGPANGRSIGFAD
jgi:hypothetical protein